MNRELNHSISRRVAAYTIRRRNLLTITACLFSLLLASGILRSSFDTSFSALMTQSDPYLDELDVMQATFPSSIEFSFLFVSKQQKNVFSLPVLQAISQLKESYRAIPDAIRLTSLIDYYSPETQRRLFSNPLDSYSQEALDALVEPALNDRLLSNNLLSHDASLTFAIVTTDVQQASAQERSAMANAALQLRDELRDANPLVDIHVNGEVLLEQSSQQAMIDDLTTLLPFVILACVLVICYCFKSVKVGICILSHTMFTLLCTLGILGYLGFAFNSISVIAPLVVVIVSVANSVHIISIYRQFLHKGLQKVEAMQESIAYNFQPITLAAVTTAIGFSSLNMSSSPAIQDFGQIVAIGIAFAYILTLVYLPSVLIKYSKTFEAEDFSKPPFLHDALEKLNRFTRQHDKSLFWFFSILALVTALLLPLNETDFNRLDFIATDADIKQYYDEVSEHLNRGPSLTYGIDTNASYGAIEPQFLSRVEEFTRWLQAQADIESIASIVDVVKTVNRVQHQDDTEFYRIPDDIDTVSNYLFDYEFVQSEDFPLLSFINEDYSLMNLFINATPISNQALIDLDQRISSKFSEDFPQATLLHGSRILLFARMDELVTIELLQGYSISLILITLSLMVGLRSVYFGLLSILPNLLPATMVFGVWALLVGKLDPFVMMLFSISIGLVVDDTVHILSHYLNERRNGSDKTSCINHAIKTAGPALIITTLVLALGTTVLIGAHTLYFQQAAKLLVPIVVLALLLDLLYLPTILQRLDKGFENENTMTS